MSKAERTRQFIIEKSADIFNKKGYLGTSLRDITNVTGLSKGSIYGNFRNKDDLAIAVFQYSADQLFTEIKFSVDAVKGNAEAKLLRLAYHSRWKKLISTGGCPVTNAAIESDDTFPELFSLVRQSVKNSTDYVSNLIELGKKEGVFRPEIIARDYAFLFMMLIEGGIILSKTLGSHHPLLEAIGRIEKIIQHELKF